MTNKIFQMGKVCLTTILFSFLATKAMAHPGGAGELGMMHVINHVDHFLHFIMLGFLAAMVTLSKVNFSFVLASGTLFIAFLIEAMIHGFGQGFLFGLELFIGVTLITLCSWRVTFWFRGQMGPLLKKQKIS